MKILYLHIIALCASIAHLSAQIQSVEMYGSGIQSVGKRFQVTEAAAFGGGVKLHIVVMPNVVLTINGGFSQYSIEQTDEVKQWGWTIWERRYRNWVSIYSSDTANFSSRVVSVQSMESLPISVSLGYQFEVTPDLVVRPSVGAGIEFYTRKLYHEETWTRKFPADEYQFTYTYHNFAPYKYGNPLFMTAAVAARYSVTRLLALHADVSYAATMETKGQFGYDNYPLSGIALVSIGIGFNY